MNPVSRGLTIPGTVAIVFDTPKMILENCGAISNGFTMNPVDENAPIVIQNTTSTTQMAGSVI